MLVKNCKEIIKVGDHVRCNGDNFGICDEGLFEGQIEGIFSESFDIRRKATSELWTVRFDNVYAEIYVLNQKTTPMKKLNFFVKRLLDSNLRKLVKADFMDECLNLTNSGREALLSIMVETHKDKLVGMAKEVIKERKEDKDN